MNLLKRRSVALCVMRATEQQYDFNGLSVEELLKASEDTLNKIYILCKNDYEEMFIATHGISDFLLLPTATKFNLLKLQDKLNIVEYYLNKKYNKKEPNYFIHKKELTTEEIKECINSYYGVPESNISLGVKSFEDGKIDVIAKYENVVTDEE